MEPRELLAQQATLKGHPPETADKESGTVTALLAVTYPYGAVTEEGDLDTLGLAITVTALTPHGTCQINTLH